MPFTSERAGSEQWQEAWAGLLVKSNTITYPSKPGPRSSKPVNRLLLCMETSQRTYTRTKNQGGVVRGGEARLSPHTLSPPTSVPHCLQLCVREAQADSSPGSRFSFIHGTHL